MGFLIAEIIGLLLLAALFGGAFVYWWLRRDAVDISSEYAAYRRSLVELEEARKAASTASERAAGLEAERDAVRSRLADELQWREAVKTELAKLEPVSIDPVMQQVMEVDANVRKLRPADLTGVEARLDAVEAAFDALRPTDLSPVEAKIASLEQAVGGLRATDVSGLETGVRAISKTLDALRPADLDPVRSAVADVDRKVSKLRNADVSGVDASLKALSEGITRLERRVAAPAEATDLSPVHARLEQIERLLERRPVSAPPVPAQKRRRRRVRRPGHNLLSKPTHGAPDDLKLISGVGPKLERMLHDLGAYYFWQVADWRKSDVAHVDEKLEVFKGRIERDEWVRQARELSRQEGVAHRP